MSDATAIKLANEHRQVLNDISTLAQKEVLNILNDVKDLPVELFNVSIRETIPTTILPYSNVAAQVSNEYYSLLRDEAQNNTGRNYTPLKLVASNLPNTTSLAYTLTNTGLAMNDKGIFKTYQDIEQFYGGAALKTVFSGSREQFIETQSLDTFSKRVTYVPRSQACAWCLLNASAYGDRKFHDYCRCVVAASFTGESDNKFDQPFLTKFDKDYKAALTILQEEGVAKSELSVGSERYYSNISKQIRKDMSDWRNTVGQDYIKENNLTKAEVRNQMNALLDNAIADVKSGKKDVYYLDKLFNKGNNDFDFDLYSSIKFDKPIQLGVSYSNTQSNILKVMRQNFDYK